MDFISQVKVLQVPKSNDTQINSPAFTATQWLLHALSTPSAVQQLGRHCGKKVSEFNSQLDTTVGPASIAMSTL